MKDKPIVVIITLTAGLVACICCILKEAGLLATLIAVFASLLIFLVIGMIVNSIIAKQRHIAEEREKDEKQRLEELEKEEQRKREEEELQQQEQAVSGS